MDGVLAACHDLRIICALLEVFCRMKLDSCAEQLLSALIDRDLNDIQDVYIHIMIGVMVRYTLVSFILFSLGYRSDVSSNSRPFHVLYISVKGP